MIDYTATDIPAANLDAVLAAAAREHPTSLVLTQVDVAYPDDVLYRIHIKGVSVRGILALQAATKPQPDAEPTAQRPDLLYPGEQA